MISISMSLIFLYSVFGPAETVYAIGDREENGCFNNVSTCLRFPRVFRQWPRALWI